MSQTNQQGREAAPAKTRARKDWEWFWRIIATLMLIVIAWVIWVLYQITPRSVVTPMAYEPRAKSIGVQQPAATAAEVGTPLTQTSPMSAVQAGAPVLAPSQPVATASDAAMDQAQAAARAGAHQASADVQAAALDKKQESAAKEERLQPEGLKLSTEIGAPPAEKKKSPE
jgi:hypothetical protein